MINVTEMSIYDVLLLEPKVFEDSRGYFMEAWNQERYKALGIDSFVQDNISVSRKGCLRGLHIQAEPKAQGKLVQVLYGSVFDVVVDLRDNSPTYKKWIGVEISCQNKKQLWIPKGFAHGFYVLSEVALFAYKCNDYYSTEHEITVRWDDPELNILWPNQEPLLSEKDQKGIFLKDLNKAVWWNW